MGKFKKQLIRVISVLSASCLTLGFAIGSLENAKERVKAEASLISKTNANIKTNQENFYDDSVVQKLPETVSNNDEISVIVTMNVESVMDRYNASSAKMTVSEFANGSDGKAIASKIKLKRKAMLRQLDNSGVAYELGEQYDTLFGGFEITVKAKDFEKINDLYTGQATLIVGEVYEPAQTVVINNDVEVYDTGIFDSSKSLYQGDGVVVAVLDTGLDYTHSAFSVQNFTTSDEAFTLKKVSEKVSQTVAADFTAGLTGQDVYMSKKVPFAYDYADKDPDVLPINSDHGTHVAGIIAGKDDTITGVAPNAQLAIMKVFSDSKDGAKDSWILSALEDCVVLGVDVINMSLGSGCGFTREVDEENVNKIYDKIREAGISLITAAGNDYNATHASEANGSNPLTTNPDSGVVGAPSTYEGALSVASVDGVKTPYLKYGQDIIYFTEASTSDAETKHFVDEILQTVGDDVQSHDFTYVTIPGVGREQDYPDQGEDYYKGKIVLVKRGTTMFEDKVRVALIEKGAAGIIIYNNVSGDISMSVGANVGAVCSISQDEGEKLAAQKTGILKISKTQVAGPFMSDFSSWGPTSDLKIKPEITAHGGEILSAVPGQDYDRLSGTSMAAPNQAGAAALIRQYVKYSNVFGTEEEMEGKPVEVTNLVNQLMMSTADIVYNKNGLPYAVRKQGAGLVNITKSYTAESYLTTYDKAGNLMDKTKLELGDDKQRTGVYEMTFNINNISGNSASYDVSALLTTEGVSPTFTSHGETTSTQDGRLLDKATTTVVSVEGKGVQNGNTVVVEARGTATVKVKVVLAEEEKQYIKDSFAYGMYVEGFILLTATGENKVDLNVPMLAFFGDWTEAPIFDEEYYDTHKDEIDTGIDAEDKLMADAYATRVIGGLYSDYIATMGTYYFEQNPFMTQIAANKQYIAISNQQSDYNATINSISSIWAGMLRNAKEVNISIVEDATGTEIFNKTNYNQRKSSSSGNTVYQSSIDVDFSAIEYNLKNNTKYTVKVTSYIDYGTKEEQKKNVRNTFEFPLYVDIQAPVVTDVKYYTEYDKDTRKTKLFADLSIYDNHYTMGMQIGQIVKSEDPKYAFSMETFDKYVTPVYSSFNSTSKVTVELTDHVAKLKNSMGLNHQASGDDIEKNNNSFIAICYDYAMNSATYEIRLPDEILTMNFTEDTITLNPNETKDISTVLNVFPSTSWLQVLDYETTDSDTVDVVNNTLIAKKSGQATITAIGRNDKGQEIRTSVQVKVRSEDDEGYYGKYTLPEVNKFELTGYTTLKAYYSIDSDEREIGVTGGTYVFDKTYTLSMYPSEKVQLNYVLDSYFPNNTKVSYKVGKSEIATVDKNEGIIEALAEGETIVSVNVIYYEIAEDGTVSEKPTLYNGRVSIQVKDPFTANAIYLMSYKGLGGEVVIPDDRGITMIYEYAFSGYEYVEKDTAAGDVIDAEDPYFLKQSALGEDTITKVVIPEGVTHINRYAFANLTALKEVKLPKSLVNIGVGAFSGCTSLETINLENVKFINERAFSGCNLQEMDLSSVVAIGNYAFENCKLNYVSLPESSQSLGIGAFYGNVYLNSVEFKASKIKLGKNVFDGCTALEEITVNATVIAPYAFSDCTTLKTVRLGKDVEIIGEYAFAGTKVSAFEVDFKNTTFTTDDGGTMLYKGENKEELVLVAPAYSGVKNTVTTTAKKIGTGAFSGNTKIFNVVANEAVDVAPYAFAGCSNLKGVEMNKLENVGNFAFANTGLTALPNLQKVKEIGEYAFAYTNVKSVEIADGTNVGDYAFYLNTSLESVVIGNDVKVGEGAFYCPIQLFTLETLEPETNSEALSILNNYYKTYNYTVQDDEGNVVASYQYRRYDFTKGVYSNLKSLSIGENATIGEYAFAGNANLNTFTLDDGAKIGDYAFYNVVGLKTVDLSNAVEIGAYAFSGTRTQDYQIFGNAPQTAYELQYINGDLYVVDYVYAYNAPAFEEAKLTAVTKLGEGAFAFNGSLKQVTLGTNIQEIPDYAFACTKALEKIVLPDEYTAIGDYAFYASSLKEINLENLLSVGDNALALTYLEKVSLKDGATVGDSAFAYVETLKTVENMQNVKSIGDYAFMYTALEKLDLTNVERIGSFAFRSAAVKEIAFGDKLTELGDNPFEGCYIKTFAQKEEKKINEIVETTLIETYDVSDTVKVIGGVLYQLAPNGGMILVSYPMANEGVSCVVEEGTVKISARAFVGASLESVILSSTLETLGDKAFYGCSNLSYVVFKSYEAPTLEEEYDEYYVNEENLPFTGNYGGKAGLGIANYYMWNAASNPNNYYFGATFVNYIGKVSDKIVMVKPANGQYYDTFIFAQYFDSQIDGANAATDATLQVIAMIEGLPSAITLADKDAVETARAAFEKIASFEQKALVLNLTKLTSAEAMIEYLEYENSKSEEDLGDTPDTPFTPKDEGCGCGSALGGTFSVMVALLLATAVVLRKVKASKKDE